MASGGKPITVASRWDNEPKSVLLDRIKMLEEEVKILKERMDQLRKAKNQTIIKREHEYVEVGNPISEKDIQSNVRCRELEEKITKLRQEHAKQIQQLREEKDSEIARVNEQVNAARNETRQGPCGHEEEIRDLRSKISTLQNEADQANTETEAQKDIIDGLWYQLSVKEAEWCDREERMMFQFQKTFASIQEGLSEKVARQLQARIAEVWQQAGGGDEPTIPDEEDDNAKNEKKDSSSSK